MTGVQAAGEGRGGHRPDDLPQVGEVQRAVDVVDLDLLDAQPLDQRGPQGWIHARADLQPHDLAEAPASELILDRGQEVVGFVVDLEVGVPGDPEEVVADDLHPWEERVQVVGDDVLQRHERVLVISTNRGSTSLGTFTRA